LGHGSSAGLLITHRLINRLRAAQPFQPLARGKLRWSANALGMQGECASDALVTSQDCAHFGPCWPFRYLECARFGKLPWPARSGCWRGIG
jgi:hypothetical protein